MPLRMFVRFRQSKLRLQLSLVETRRSNGKVRHEHVAGLGAVPIPPSVADRIAFWTRLHERLARLANRLDAEAQAKVLGAVHERIPIVTLAEQHALQLENANADLRFWNGLAGMHAETIEGHKALTAAAERKIADSEAQRAKVSEKAAQARNRVARIERGEDVQGGLGQPVTYDVKRMLRDASWTTSDMRHAELLNVVAEAIGGEPVFSTMLEAGMRAQRRAEKAVLRRMARRRGERLGRQARP
jgi:hypothetical protein